MDPQPLSNSSELATVILDKVNEVNRARMDAISR